MSAVVVITGAGSGIGRATALAFAADGATVVATDINLDSAVETVRQIEAAGAPTAHVRRVDVSDADAMESLATWVADTFGAPDVVVNNAGIAIAGPMLQTSVDDWEKILGVNLWGVIHGCRLFGRQMVDGGKGGHVVNVASAAAFAPNRAFPAYATTKAAVLMLSDCLRGELAGDGIQVHTICPGFADTPITTNTRFVGVSAEEQDRRRQAAAKLYRRRGLKAETVAAAIVRAVHRGTQTVPVGTEAWMSQAMHRFMPSVGRRLARIDLTPRTPTHA